MRAGLLLPAVLVTLGFPAYGQPPAIDQEGVRNAASQIPPSLPGGELAPGAVVVITGQRLGTRVHIRQSGSDWMARVISSTTERLQAIVPPQIAPGDAQLIVTRDGMVSRPFSIRIANSAFGIGEILQTGRTATLLGTGLGHARTVEVIAGGRVAGVLSWRSRRGRPGWEQIRFVVPRGASQGCHVPVIVKTSDHVSNAVTIAIVGRGQHCPGNAPDGALLLARMSLHLQLGVGKPVELAVNAGAAVFSQAALRMLEFLPPAGACTSYTTRLAAVPSPATLGMLLSQMGAGRDAGPEVVVAGPAGTWRLPRQSQYAGLYSAVLGPSIESGSYRITGTGGKDIGPFLVETRTAPKLDFVHPEQLDTIDRARGATVEWKGSTAEQQVVIAAVNVDPLSSAAALCLCVAPGQSGRWRLDPLWLAHLPASQDLPGVPLNYLMLASMPIRPQLFLANGIVLPTFAIARTVRYQ